MNTPRRARMGAGVMEEQQRKIANAKTALQIAAALREGTAGNLAKVESLADVERIQESYRRSMYEADRAQRKPYGGSKVSHEPAPEHIAHAKPATLNVGVQRWDVEKLQAALKGKGVSSELKRLAAMAAKDTYSHHDSRDAEAVAKVASAIKKHIPNPGDQGYKRENRDARDLHGLANRWTAGVREYEANKRLGLTSTETAKELLSSYADARVNRANAGPVAVAERNLIGMKIPGFFPTPQTLAQRMASMADVQPGHAVLEPSAGTGRLADAVKAAQPAAKISVVEMASSLRDVLAKKGYEPVHHDFTEMAKAPAYDRIVMNPPFEKGQDMAHVKQAYDMLKPGGKIVAIMGEGAFFRGDKQATEFRSWLDSAGGSSEKLPEGTFKESNTGVNTRLVTITKPGMPQAPVAAVPDALKGPAGWSDAARSASAEVRTANAKPKDPSVMAAVERAMARAEANAAKPVVSTLAAPAPATPTPATPSAPISKSDFLAKAEVMKAADGTHMVKGPGTNGQWVKTGAGTETAAKLVVFRNTVEKAAPAAAKSSTSRKLMGALGPVAIATAMLAGANEAKAEGTSQAKGAAKEGAIATAGLAAFSAGIAGATYGLVKAGLTAARAAPVVQAALIVGGGVHGAVTAKPGERLSAAAKGAFAMSLPGMVVSVAHEVSSAAQARVAMNKAEQQAKSSAQTFERHYEKGPKAGQTEIVRKKAA